MRIAVRRDDFFGRGGSQPPRRAAFIAYRMRVAESINMRDQLSELLLDRNIQPLHGDVPYGDDWGKSIRDRISKSRLMVADVTGPSREVMFEVGFAGNKLVLPVVARAQELESVPSWLRGVNIPSYWGAGVARLADLVSTALATRSPNKARTPPTPGRVLWVQSTTSPDWVAHCRTVVERWCSERGLLLTVVDNHVYSREDLRELHRHWLVIGAIDGTEQDYLIHYLMGDIAARRRAGSGSGKGQYMNRQGVLLTAPGKPVEMHVATSILQMRREIVSLVAVDDLEKLMHTAITNYQAWLRDADTNAINRSRGVV